MTRKSVTALGYTHRNLAQTVYEAAIARINEAFDTYERVIVAFSGGKDSTVVLNLAREIAEERDRLPLTAYLYDDELVDPDTIAYCEQMKNHPDLDFQWYCVPIQHTLGSRTRSSWWTWDPDERDVWARDKPAYAIHESEGWTKHDDGRLPDFTRHLATQDAAKGLPRPMVLAGIRTQESFNRRRALMTSGGWRVMNYAHYDYGKPIYDWAWQDIWLILRERGWPYSAFYDKCYAAGITPHLQRVAPWGNAAQARDVRFWPQFYADFWEKAIRRLPELRAQARYGNTKLYRALMNKPAGLTWQQFTRRLLAQLNDEDRGYWVRQIKNELLDFKRANSMPFPDEPAIDVDDGRAEKLHSWKHMAFMVSKNDRTGRDRA